MWASLLASILIGAAAAPIQDPGGAAHPVPGVVGPDGAEAIEQALREVEAARTGRSNENQEQARERIQVAFDLLDGVPAQEGTRCLAAWLAVEAEAEALGMLTLLRSTLERIVAVREGFLPGERAELLDARNRLAIATHRTGDVQRAQQLFESVLTARLQMLPPEHRDVLVSRENLAMSWNAVGELARAQDALEEVEAIRARTLSSDDPDLLRVWQNLTLIRTELGDLEGALRFARAVHEARERTLPPDDFDMLASKHNLASTLSDIGELDEARELMESVHRAYERLLPPDAEELLDYKHDLAWILIRVGDFESALALAEELRDRCERTLPPEHTDLLDAQELVAVVRGYMGEVEEQLAQLEQIHAARVQRLPSNHPDLLVTSQILAESRREVGDLEGALALIEAAHSALARERSDTDLDLLQAKQNLAATRKELGDFEGALALERAVHDVRTENLPAEHPSLLDVKQNLAGTLLSMGRNDEAESLFREVLRGRESRLPPEHPVRLAANLNLAAALSAKGEVEASLKLLERVHAIRERTLAPTHPGLMRAKENLAVARMEIGDLRGALELERAVSEVRRRVLGPGHPDLLKTQRQLCETFLRLGDPRAAFDQERSRLEGQLALVERLRTRAPRAARAGAIRELRDLPWSLLVSRSLAGPGDLHAKIFAVLENLRDVSTASTVVALAAARFPEVAALRARAAEARVALNQHSLEPPAKPDERIAWENELVTLAGERDRLERVLRLALNERGAGVQNITHAEVAKALPSNTVVISFFRYWKRFAWDQETGIRPPAVDSLLAFVVTPDARVRRVELGSSSEIETLARRWRQRLESGVPSRSSGMRVVPERSERDLGEELRERVMDPCIEVIGSAPPATLHVVLDDFLHLLPVEALPWGERQRLGDVTAIRLEVSMRRLIAEPRRVESPGTLLALGNVDFDAEGVVAPSARIVTATPRLRSAGGRSAAPFLPLPHSGTEVEELARLYEASLVGEPLILREAAATKRALQELAPRARFLHLATHGWFAPDDSGPGAIDGRAEASGGLTEGLGQAVMIHEFAPETLCGLALAGANRGVNELGKVPGILTAEELATLDLSDCELAVLSACETNVGLSRAGQGVQSLQGALHAAGARTAITSLWSVGDAATRDLMRRFYENLWDEGLGSADALWRAKSELRAEGAAPRDWAPWVLTGDPD